MPGVARVGDKLDCNPLNVISAGSPTVFVNGIAVGRVGDPTPGHPGGSPAVMLTGNTSSVFADGISICIVGSIDATHGSGPHKAAKVAVGSTDVSIG